MLCYTYDIISYYLHHGKITAPRPNYNVQYGRRLKKNNKLQFIQVDGSSNCN